MKQLTKGDTVGIISVSSPVSKDVLLKSIDYLERVGFVVKTSKNVLADKGYMAGSIKQRVDDFHEMLKDKEVKAIFCSYGGTSAIQLLPYIDYNLFRNNPKIFVGLSDPSILSIALNSKTNIPTFHGPTGYNFGEAGMTNYTEKYFLKALTNTTPLGLISESKWQSLKKGESEGIIIGGNLSIIQSLLGTSFEPDWTNKILFWEDLFVEPHIIDSILTQFKIIGVFDKIKGMIIGTLVECNEEEFEINESINDIIIRITKEYSFPIISNVDLGHTDDKLTIPIGTKIKMVSNNTSNEINFIESPFLNE